MERLGYFSPMLCPICDDWIVAPIASEFIEGGKARHMWECETCQESTEAAVSTEWRGCLSRQSLSFVLGVLEAYRVSVGR
jgi:hypothetical protein